MARLVLTQPGEDVTVGGDVELFGTVSGGEEITVVSGDIVLDASFNRGGDTIYLPGEAEEYTAYTQGSLVILVRDDGSVTLTIPVGTAGTEIVFGGDDSRTLLIDTVQGRVELDGEVIDSSPDPLSPGNEEVTTTYTVLANSPTVTEGDSGTRFLTYTITLSETATQDVTLNYVTTTGGTAEINDDFVPVSGTVTIAAGTNTAFISVPILGDTLVEGNETVQLQISGSDLAATTTLTGTIIDDDQQQTVQNLSAGSEVIVGTDSNDTFRASNNELGSGDVVQGMGGTDTLQVFVDENATGFGSINYSAFELDSVERVLVTNDGPDPVTLDMSGATGVELVGSVNSSNSVTFDQVTSDADVLIDNLTIVEGSTESDVAVYYQDDVVLGEINVTISDSDADDITLGTVDNSGNRTNTGIDDVNLIVQGSSTIETLDTELTTLDISGSGDLEIQDALEDTVRSIDAAALAGDITISFRNNTVGVTYEGSAQDDNVTAGDGSDDIDTNAGNDTVFAFGGDDNVDLGAGTNTVFGGLGNDVITATNADGSLADGDNTVFGEEGDDTITLGDGSNTIFAGIGNDTVVAGDGGNYVDAGDGGDDVTLGSGADFVVTGGGFDIIRTGDGNDVVVAGANFAGDDSTAGGRQDDALYFGGGVDELRVDAGTLDVDYTNVFDLEILTLTTAGTTVLAAEAQEAGIVTINGSSGNDVIDASAFTSDLTVSPGSGDDNVSTGSGDDTFVFSQGELTFSDVITAGTGYDTIVHTGAIADYISSTGIDEIVLLSDGSADGPEFYGIGLVAGNADADGVLILDGSSLLSNENGYVEAFGADYALDVTFGAGNDTVYTSTGDYDDNVTTGAGVDNVTTYDGDDNIRLGSGDDTANAGAGADELYGDLGADTLNLGVDADVDTVIYASVSESSVASGRDTINDFDSGEDQIDISELLENAGVDTTDVEFISANDLDAAEAQMVAGDGIISVVFIETLPGEPTNTTDDPNGFLFVDLNDDGELDGSDLQIFINGENVAEGDVVIDADPISGQTGFESFSDQFASASSMMVESFQVA